MQAFGRMRLDVDNCVNELVEFGVVKKLAGDPSTYSAVKPEHENIAKLLDIFLEGTRLPGHRGIVAVGPALPRNDRPRREDAGHLRVDSHRRPSPTSRS
jgi:hypothetical protein